MSLHKDVTLDSQQKHKIHNTDIKHDPHCNTISESVIRCIYEV